MIKEQLTEKIKGAMKEKDSVTLAVLRSLKTAFSNHESEKNAKALDESTEIQIIQKQIKQRKDSASIFIEQGRDELASNELAQAAVLESYLPEQVSQEEAESIIDEIIVETGASSMRDMGKVMGAVKGKLAGKLDNKTISDIIKRRLS